MKSPTNHDVTAALDAIEASERPSDHPRTVARQRVTKWKSNAQRKRLPISNPHDDKGAKVLDVDSTLKWEPGHIGRK